MKLKSLFASSIISICCLALGVQAKEAITADAIFSSLEHSVFQIRIIEKKSGSQSALGTGFFVQSNILATNYHVVSSKVLEPENFRIEVSIEGQDKVLRVVAVDVVSDLALLQFVDEQVEGKAFSLAQQPPKKGALLYSLGNPHDLGMTVVQGNYNGLVDNKFLDRIHFSGAVNSGMSGGPTVNANSEVVGINVASSGNQIGFLVPVEKLQALLATDYLDQKNDAQLAIMAEQIKTVTNAMVEDLLTATWPQEKMGDAFILGKTVDWFECWGNSDTNKEIGLLEIARGCNNADNIFLSPRFNTGFFEYEFYYTETSKWPTTSFYRLLARNTSNAQPGNQANREQVGNYVCNDQVIKSQNKGKFMQRRASYCVRPYKKLEGLYDVFYMGLSIDREQKAIMDHFTLAGVSEEAADRFLQRFVEVLAWQ